MAQSKDFYDYQTVKTMRDNLSNLNLGASTQKEFNQILSGITEKVKNLRASTKDGVIKFTDQNQVIKDIKAIEQKLQRLGIDTEFLSVNEKNLQKSVKVIEEMTAARRKYTTAVEEANKKEQAAQQRDLYPPTQPVPPQTSDSAVQDRKSVV